LIAPAAIFAAHAFWGIKCAGAAAFPACYRLLFYDLSDGKPRRIPAEYVAIHREAMVAVRI
jgi:hypothetical protein